MTAAVTASRHDAGNIEYEAHQVEGQPGTFVVLERWESRGALEGIWGHPACRSWCPGCWS
ncbi:putative quinol monooxygenase [Streptomyces sp. NPDC087856]|uniref:putative quinol monooxygenase n=1 Tax=Streptomyces sp. NPDC087856 TaxID=3365811 RepID=UPI00381DDF1A